MNMVENKVVGNLEICIYIDNDAINPRENYAHLGEILYHNRSKYILGDRQTNNTEMELKAQSKDVVCFPVYAYIHSGIALNMTGFSCPWDSGQSGIIYATKKKIRQWFNCKNITKKTIEKVRKIFEGELLEFQSYLNGEVYGYEIKKRNGEILDSCWGFYDFDVCLNEAKESANYMRISAA